MLSDFMQSKCILKFQTVLEKWGVSPFFPYASEYALHTQYSGAELGSPDFVWKSDLTFSVIPKKWHP